MSNAEYELRYLSLFFEDLSGIIRYIAEELHNPDAASDLLDKVEKAIEERKPFAESFLPYPTLKKRKWPYYTIDVGNYVIYYVVINHRIMEVRRILYKGRDRMHILDEERNRS
ncbi:MAG: type II toxin-antitoxin system RelE/ParE family toxin [Lachnospiraceae bacterium]|nr:type II toxin-antitoxin system RelE/ParE family toxin [Lachnospiraceae bacterium]MBQ6197516.1 type II toxin-antitoxin system RelE/ParE family toxin [Lachnospiraceae bacterium]